MEPCPLCGQPYTGHEGIFVDEENHVAVIDGEIIRLTHRISQVFAGLAKGAPRLVTKAYLMDYVYGLETDDEPGQKIIDVYIMRIRQRIKHTRFEVVTIWGGGFKLVEIADGKKDKAA